MTRFGLGHSGTAQRSQYRNWIRTTVALAAPAALALGVAIAPINAAPATAAPVTGLVPTTSAGAPQTIPGLATWTKADGTLNVTDALKVDADSVSSATAKMLVDGLKEKLGRTVAQGDASAAGDVVLSEDTSRKDELGDEGYELTVSDRIQIVGATDKGVFYGAQTVLQILTEGTEIPHGSSIDKPEYAERGVGICACQVTVSVKWFERLMKDMAYLKLNQLWMETKVESDAYDKANFWGYFTEEQAKQLNDMAKKYHITLIPEVNSPGHMAPWLKNYPELQLVDKNGNKDADRLDITQPAAYTMITTLIDEYFDVFDTPYWHMGGDEYMLGSAYANYPQFQNYIDAHPEIFPAGSVPTDVVIHFMNSIDDYVKSKGKTLRIWNDSVLGGTKLTLNSDIVVEHWTGGGNVLTPAQLIAQGHSVENSSYALYLIRQKGADPFNARSLWDKNWDVRDFYGFNDVADGAGTVTGAKLSVWPDNAAARTENQVEASLFAANRFIAQATWASPRPVASYDDFAELSDTLGHAPGYENVVRTPVPNGAFQLDTAGDAVTAGVGVGSTLSAGGAEATSLTLSKTDDSYYTVTTPAGLCLTMTGGSLTLGAPLDQGRAATLATCNPSDNLQKWMIQSSGDGFTIENAITLLPLVVGEDETLVQQAPDLTPPAVFTFQGSMTGSISAPSATSLGSNVEATITLGNWLPNGVTHVTADVAAPQGWGVSDSSVSFADIAAGSESSKSLTFTVSTSAALAASTIGVTVHYTDASGAKQSLKLSTQVTVTCSAHASSPDALARVDSQETDYESTPGTNAIDGDPNTFWGTQWYKADPGYPHEITVDLGENASICGISYLPRQSSSNGQIKDYEIYLSDDPASPAGEPIATGSFELGFSAKTVAFDGAQSGRYLTLRALSENGGVVTHTTSVAELTVDRAVQTPVPATPTLTAEHEKGEAGDSVLLTVTGKPFWQYGVQFRSDPVDLGAVRTDASGAASIVVTVPASAPPGEYHFVLLDGDTDVAEAAFTVTATAPSPGGSGAGNGGSGSSNPASDDQSLASTGSDLRGAGVLALLLAGFGAVMMLTRRLRVRHTSHEG